MEDYKISFNILRGRIWICLFAKENYTTRINVEEEVNGSPTNVECSTDEKNPSTTSPPPFTLELANTWAECSLLGSSLLIHCQLLRSSSAEAWVSPPWAYLFPFCTVPWQERLMANCDLGTWVFYFWFGGGGGSEGTIRIFNLSWPQCNSVSK